MRVGYMERYDGPDTITSGGAYIAANGVGGEVFNFKPSRGKCYGYAMSLHFGGLNLRFIDGTRRWKVGDSLSGVDVVFIARKQGIGQVVVGWYKNATVFHKQYRVRRGTIPGMSESMLHFLCVTDATSAYLLSDDKRTFEVPYAPAGHKGFPGQSNVWYPEHHVSHPPVRTFIQKLRRYISTASAEHLVLDQSVPINPGRKKKASPNHAHNTAVEEAAIDAVWNHYEHTGYTVHSVETEYVGWDLVAKKGSQTLYLEVKGVSGTAIYFELTPNEYAKLKTHASRYRVCVVCEALVAPRIYELFPEQRSGAWNLVSKKQKVLVPLVERIAAVGAEVAQVVK